MSNWSRAQLKERAKAVLRKNYGIALVVALILAIVSGGGSGAGSNSNYRVSDNDINYQESIYDYDGNFKIDDFGDNIRKNIIIGAITGVVLLVALFAIAIAVFLFNPLAVGCYKFFSTSAESPHTNMAPVGIAFQKGNYWGIVGGILLKNIYIFLWTLLFIIPGIIKGYAYRMVPYILADNPHMNANEAITLSRKMMDGEKWRAFVLDLSFIGWYLLGMLACGIGVLFVHPYKFSTNAQLYLVLRDKGINNGYCTPGMLNLRAN